MEKELRAEMLKNLDALSVNSMFEDRDIFLFGHCNATIELADELIKRNLKPMSILDNNPDKYSIIYKGIRVSGPDMITKSDKAIVLIVSRFYEQMAGQLRNLGFSGDIIKLVDYNSYSEYSLSADTVRRKKERVARGVAKLSVLKNDYPGFFIVFCPFPALGDIYLCMSYLNHFLDTLNRDKCLVCVVGNAQRQVADLFGYTEVKALSQTDMDEAVQAVIYINDTDCYIAHQDRPYVVDLHRALYIKCIPLETIYKCGVFGLPQDTKPHIPTEWVEYKEPKSMIRGKSAILSPYAKSVPNFPMDMWKRLADDLKADGYIVFSNVVGDESPIDSTVPISPKIAELKSAVEKAGLFIGIRSKKIDRI